MLIYFPCFTHLKASAAEFVPDGLKKAEQENEPPVSVPSTTSQPSEPKEAVSSEALPEIAPADTPAADNSKPAVQEKQDKPALEKSASVAPVNSPKEEAVVDANGKADAATVSKEMDEPTVTATADNDSDESATSNSSEKAKIPVHLDPEYSELFPSLSSATVKMTKAQEKEAIEKAKRADEERAKRLQQEKKAAQKKAARDKGERRKSGRKSSTASTNSEVQSIKQGPDEDGWVSVKSKVPKEKKTGKRSSNGRRNGGKQNAEASTKKPKEDEKATVPVIHQEKSVASANPFDMLNEDGNAVNCVTVCI